MRDPGDCGADAEHGPGPPHLLSHAEIQNPETSYDSLGKRMPTSASSTSGPTDELPRTIELQFADTPETTGGLIQTPGADLRLDIWAAETREDGSRRWEFAMATPGDYRVVLLTKETFSNADPQWWADGLTGTLVTDRARRPFTLRREGEEPYPIIHYWKLIRSEVGALHVAAPGTQELVLEDLPVVDSKWDKSGANVVALRLEPIGEPRHDGAAE